MFSDICARVNIFYSTCLLFVASSIWDSKHQKPLAYWTVRWKYSSLRPASSLQVSFSKLLSTGFEDFHAICLFFLFVISSKCLGFFLRMNLWGENVLFCHLQKPFQPQHCGLCRVGLAEVCIFREIRFFCCFYLILAKFRSLWKICASNKILKSYLSSLYS